MLILTSFLIYTPLWAAQKQVSGIVYENDGTTPLIGATVQQHNNPSNAVMTDNDGKYILNISGKNAAITVSFIGYEPQTKTVKDRTHINFVMQTNAVALDDVVVTALGISRQQKSLGYAVSKIDNEELTNTVSGNWLQSMNGKVAGMQFDQAGSGPVGSVRVVLRGESSLSYGSNEALFVVDGVPISSGTTASGSGASYTNADGSVDFGNDAADINPEDVESVSVLKGPAATALYGSRAANGAIVITTKSGRKDKGIGVTINSSVTWEKAGYWPDFQTEYGPGADLGAAPWSHWTVKADQSTTGMAAQRNQTVYTYGAKYDPNKMVYAYDSYNWETGMYTPVPFVYADDWFTGFFETGVTYKNTITIDGNNGKGNSGRFSVTDTRSDWILPNTGYKNQSISFSTNNKLNQWVSMQTRVNYIHRSSDNLPNNGVSNDTPMWAILRNVPINHPSSFATEYFGGRITNESVAGQRTVLISDKYTQNPYFQLYEALNTLEKNRVFGNASFDINLPVKGLTLMLRGAMDMTDEFRTMRRPYASPYWNYGMYKEQSIRKLETNMDFLLRYENNKLIGNHLQFNVSFGGNTMTNKYYTQNIQLKKLEIEGIYNVNNAPASDIPVPYQYRSKKRVNSVYGFASFGWDNTYYLDITGRNDWSSTLARGNWSFFYPSVAASILLDQAFKVQERAPWVDMLKLRLSWANVGNDTSAYALIETYGLTNYTGGFSLPGSINNPKLKPENVESWEGGVELRFLHNRIGLDAALYNSSATNQIVNASVDASVGATGIKINAGEIRNRGIELSAHFTPIQTRDWEWTLDLNWSKNWNKLISLQDGWDPETPLKVDSGTSIGSRCFVYNYIGQEMYQLYVRGFERAPEGSFYLDENGNKVDCSGQKLINAKTGRPSITPGATVHMGNVNPDWKAGLTTRLRFKDVSLSASFAGQYGGHAFSLTNSVLGQYGRLKNSLPGRQGGMVVEGVNAITGTDGTVTYQKNNTIVEDISTYYKTDVLARNNAESAVHETSFLKCKEVRIDYSLNKKLLTKTKVLRSASLGVYATNLFCISSWPQFDPESGMVSGSTVFRGVENGSYPMSRTYGVNLKLQF